MAELIVDNATIQHAQQRVVERASFSIQPGELVALLGANGAGKSSLVRASVGLQAMDAGSAMLNGKPIHRMDAATRAKQLAYLPQVRPLAWPSRVKDVVSLGRYGYGAAPGALSDPDAQAVDKAMADCGVLSLAERATDTLSGGELARVHCARAFASNAPLIVADEPTAALDPRHQLMIMALFKNYVANGGGALVVLHDVALAAQHASQLLWMKNGEIVCQGSPSETLTAERLAEVYEVQARVHGLQVEMLEAL